MVRKPFFVESRVPANPPEFHIKPLADLENHAFERILLRLA